MLSKTFLGLRCGLLIWSVVEAGCGDLRGEPVGFREADRQWDEVLFDLLLGELFADLVEGLDSLEWISK